MTPWIMLHFDVHKNYTKYLKDATTAPRAGIKVIKIIVFNLVPDCASTVCLNENLLL